MSGLPGRVDFRRNTQCVAPQMACAVQQATTRFLALRDTAVSEFGADRWQELRQVGHDLRLHAIENLDGYLELLEDQVTRAGGQVHWAPTAACARQIVLDIARRHQVKRVVKVKSMATEEIGLALALESAGLSVFETDLGEYIVQLAGEAPSHITGPALHMTKEDIAELFRSKLGASAPADAQLLTRIAADRLRGEFLAADMGISGGNFLVPDTGTLVLVTNEGNGRMCTTLPRVFVAVVGIDKVIPDWESLAVMLTLLPRNATGQKMTAYVSFITGLKPVEGTEGPAEFHLILLDNGRSQMLRDKTLRETLLCIRCGACLNVCPVYNTVGGHAYGWCYSGPIGAILSPQLLGLHAAGDLPFASTLCGACNDICPVKVPITDILLEMRQRVLHEPTARQERSKSTLRAAARVAALVFGSPRLYRWSAEALCLLQAPFRRGGWLHRLPPPLNRWTMARPLPAFRTDFFRWWRARGTGRSQQRLLRASLLVAAAGLVIAAVSSRIHRSKRQGT